MTATAPLFGRQPPATSATVAADQKAAPSPVVRVPTRPPNRKERRRAAAIARRALVLALALAPLSARALDCSTVTYAVGQPLTADAAECLRRAVVTCEFDRDTCTARRAQAEARADACEATAAITCPPPVPRVPVVSIAVASAAAGVLAAIGAGAIGMQPASAASGGAVSAIIVAIILLAVDAR